MNPLRIIGTGSKHTPGPWAFSPWHVEEGAPAVRHGTIHGYIIATADTDDNAKLIAAAPDLYEALHDILVKFPTAVDHIDEVVVRMGLAAIAKASS